MSRIEFHDDLDPATATPLPRVPFFSSDQGDPLLFLTALQSAIEAFRRIKSEKVDVEELESIVGCFGVSLSRTELQEALKNVSADGE